MKILNNTFHAWWH